MRTNTLFKLSKKGLFGSVHVGIKFYFRKKTL